MTAVGVGLWDKRDDMVVHGNSPFNAEPPPAALAGSDLTPIDAFYSRNHGEVPRIDPGEWRLTVGGLVGRTLELSLDDLRTFEPHSVDATLQCAGNRRAGLTEIRPIEGEDPWGPCATSTAQWGGVRLSDVLGRAGIDAADGLHVEFLAPDVTDLATPPQAYGSSIPLAKALSDEVLLAWEMNGEPLPPVHGGPVRVVVPGYIGARSVKWVQSLAVRNSPSDNYFQSVAYHLLPADVDPATAAPGAGIPLGSVALNGDILTPDDGARVPPGPLEVSGYAYAGDDRGVARVDVSADAGSTWQQAELAPQRSPWTWRLWRATVQAQPGSLDLVARAWDTTGAVQPESPVSVWNPKGYANNSWARISVTVCA